MKGKEESQRVTTMKIKGDETHSFGMLDLLFRFQFLSLESNRKALAFSQCENVAPRASRQWTQTHCPRRRHFRCLVCAYKFFSKCSNLTVNSVFKIGVRVLVIVLLLYNAITLFQGVL